MNKLLILLVLTLSLGRTAHAFFDLPVKVTTIHADLRCQNQLGKGLAIAMPKAGQAGRVWHSKAGDKEGLELTVTDFRVARCPGCFSFSALLMEQVMTGEATDFEIIYSGKDSSGQTKELLRTKCVPDNSQSPQKNVSASRSQSAFIKVCPATAVKTAKGARVLPASGCLNKIVINGQELVVTSGNAQAENILYSIIKTNQLHKITKSQSYKFEGHQDNMVLMGHERQVFVVTKID